MASDKDLFLNLGHLHGLGMSDLNRDDVTPYHRPGTIAWIVDAFGARIVKYVKILQSGGMAKGELCAYASDGANVRSTSISNITSGTTTSFVTTGLTADRHNGMISYVLDDAGAAGAAPEGESSIVVKNTATLVTLDSHYPYSAALAVNDDIELIATWQAEDSADGDEAYTCMGIVVAKDGISANNYGWVQVEGVTPALSIASTAEGDPIVADAAAIGPFGTDGQELWIGTALNTLSTDEVLKQVPVHIQLFSPVGTGGSP